MSFNFTYKIENLGNIKEAKITVKPLTIIAGKNSSGKTFITKSLYTFLNTLGTPNYTNELKSKYSDLEYMFYKFTETLPSPANVDIEFIHYFEEELQKIIIMISDLEGRSYPEQRSKILGYTEDVNVAFNVTQDYISNRMTLKKFNRIKDLIDKFIFAFDNFKSVIDNHRDVTVKSVTKTLSEGFKKNFQITNLESLIKNSQTKDALISIDTVGHINLEQKSNIGFSFTSSGIEEVHKLSNIVFFDSPIYIKIRKALLNTNRPSFFHSKFSKDEKYLKGYPEYIEELYDYLSREYIETPIFEEISEEIQNTISGKLNVTKNGDILYIDDNGIEIPLSLTAMGIGNIGTIDLLIRNNIINKGSFLIMDEPEVHLHPEWQVRLAKILYRLAKAGANVVIATHSIDLLKAFQVIFEENEEEAAQYMAFNRMPYTKEFSDLDEEEKVNIILDDLSSPYHDLYMQGL